MGNDPERLQRAMLALNSILVMLRHAATEEGSRERIYAVLDSAELMPLLIMKGDYKRFEEMLEALAETHPREGALALRKFRHGDESLE
jgi:hypothetical protein